ncbi:dihydrofolate reductase family protein [Leptolyngbya sp. 7M]|uniref:dihydrofolate reductase family protein n=1 Tax=Leptolyngbya sp. 7M TaxID=2812896 RepID=UPI001B8B3F72|nr:dihydrofolate reductase family protein [Leptolyngbya sp. 7M]QYO64343.1 dihydrofolate reductase family protein [Leptolyngbya sp. 7M]
MVSKLILGTIWIGFTAYTLWIAPLDRPYTWFVGKQLLSFNWTTLNAFIPAIFWLMGIWSMIYGCLMFADGRMQRFRAWPYFLGSNFTGVMCLLPYLILKYVASNTRTSSDWQPTVFLGGDLAEKVRELKQTDGPDLHIFGSANMLQTLFKADLVDRLELMIFPVTLGTGKRLFQDGTIPAAFKVTEGQVTPNGIIVATYQRDGDVKTGTPQIETDN